MVGEHTHAAAERQGTSREGNETMLFGQSFECPHTGFAVAFGADDSAEACTTHAMRAAIGAHGLRAGVNDEVRVVGGNDAGDHAKREVVGGADTKPERGAVQKDVIAGPDTVDLLGQRRALASRRRADGNAVDRDSALAKPVGETGEVCRLIAGDFG